MTSRRTENQAAADAFDLQVYNLLRQAEARVDKNSQWAAVARHLRKVRPLVRNMMTKHDREHTA